MYQFSISAWFRQ